MGHIKQEVGLGPVCPLGSIQGLCKGLLLPLFLTDQFIHTFGTDNGNICAVFSLHIGNLNLQPGYVVAFYHTVVKGEVRLALKAQGIHKSCPVLFQNQSFGVFLKQSCPAMGSSAEEIGYYSALFSYGSEGNNRVV